MADSLQKQWRLVEAPLKYDIELTLDARLATFSEITMKFNADGRMLMYDRGNGHVGTYVVSNLSQDCNRGTISTDTYRWARMIRIQIADEATQIIDRFVDTLTSGTFDFELRGVRLVITHEDREYMFQEC